MVLISYLTCMVYVDHSSCIDMPQGMMFSAKDYSLLLDETWDSVHLGS